MDATGTRRFSRLQRFKAWFIGYAGFLAISLVGRTIRWHTIGVEHLDQIHRSGSRAIFAFWHGRIFPSTYYFRHQGIIVMTSMNADGEAIAQCIERLGYLTARGSSSRGGLRALSAMARSIRDGHDAGFTVDGPRGPRYVAKQGPVLLARETGAAIFPFHVSLEHKVQLRSWDQFQLPVPFTRALILAAEPIRLANRSSEEEVRRAQKHLQSVLDDLRKRGDGWWQAKAAR